MIVYRVYRELNKEKIKAHVALSLCFLFFIINSISFFIYGEGTEIGFEIMGASNEPQINDFRIDEDGVFELDPGREYEVIIDVTYDAGIGNITGIAIKFWYDETGNLSEKSDFNSQDTTSITNCAIVTWNYDGSVTSLAIDAGQEETSWEINIQESTLPDKTVLEDLLETEFTFKFKIRVGKIARETSGNARWQVGTKVINQLGEGDYENIANGLESGVSMNWYGQMYLPEAVNWGSLLAGIDFDDESARAKVEGIEFISNGTFDYEISVSSPWSSKDDVKVHGTQDALNSDEFALRVSTNDEFEETSAKIVSFGENFDLVEEDLAPNESYENIKDNYLYLRINEDFPESQAFSGNIVYRIGN